MVYGNLNAELSRTRDWFSPGAAFILGWSLLTLSAVIGFGFHNTKVAFPLYLLGTLMLIVAHVLLRGIELPQNSMRIALEVLVIYFILCVAGTWLGLQMWHQADSSMNIFWTKQFVTEWGWLVQLLTGLEIVPKWVKRRSGS